MRIRLEFKLADFWIGAFWRRDKKVVELVDESDLHVHGEEVNYFHLWICLLPCLPIHIWRRKVVDKFLAVKAGFGGQPNANGDILPQDMLMRAFADYCDRKPQSGWSIKDGVARFDPPKGEADGQAGT